MRFEMIADLLILKKPRMLSAGEAVRNLYKLAPFKRSLFSALRPLIGRHEKLYKHLHFTGDFVVPIDKQHSFQIHHFGFELENSLFWAGLKQGWEKTSISLWMRLVQDADVIFDIGANTGVYSLIAKSLKPTAAVYAFEPIERVFQKLEYNIKLNNFEVVCVKSAISNADGEAIVYDLPSEHIYSVTVNKNLHDATTTVVPTAITTVRLDTFIEERQIGKIDLMKIDVETHEPEVLEGFGKYLEVYKPTMLIEILNDEVGDRVESILKGKGYLYFNLDEKTDSIRKVNRITKSDFYNYLICDETTACRLGLID